MIKSVDSVTKSNFSRYNHIKYSGYIAIGTTIACALSGMRQIKLPKKSMIHKTFAIISLISMIWHLGAIKQWDKGFKEYFKFSSNKN